MKRIDFLSFLFGFLLGPFTLLAVLSTQWIRNIADQVNAVFNFGDLINSPISIFVYFVLLNLPLIAIFFLLTVFLWNFIGKFKEKYPISVVYKINLFFALGVIISVAVLSIILNFSVAGI